MPSKEARVGKDILGSRSSTFKGQELGKGPGGLGMLEGLWGRWRPGAGADPGEAC